MKHITTKVNFLAVLLALTAGSRWTISVVGQGIVLALLHVVEVTPRPEPQAAVATSEPAAAPQSPIHYFPAQFVNNALDIAEPIEQF
jgi:hypothetical protein